MNIGYGSQVARQAGVGEMASHTKLVVEMYVEMPPVAEQPGPVCQRCPSCRFSVPQIWLIAVKFGAMYRKQCSGGHIVLLAGFCAVQWELNHSFEYHKIEFKFKCVALSVHCWARQHPGGQQCATIFVSVKCAGLWHSRAPVCRVVNSGRISALVLAGS